MNMRVQRVERAAWRRLATLVVLASLLVSGCAGSGDRPGSPVRARTAASADAPELTGSTYTVVKGDTLYSIAFRARMDFRALAAANGIVDPYIIRSGQRLRLRPPAVPGAARPQKPAVATARPPGAASPPSASPPARPATATPRRPPGSALPPAPRPRTPAPAAVPRAVPPVTAERPGNTTTPRFVWPAPGRVVQAYGGSSKGLDIAGRVGEPVLAAADGQVVYAGNGLRGYGNLLIIKHDDIYLSAYGHNERLLVREGDHVKARQKIAEIGIDGSGAARLHFEVRRAGSPVDPMRYLPSK
jgi:lipoprotein NlpD